MGLDNRKIAIRVFALLFVFAFFVSSFSLVSAQSQDYPSYTVDNTTYDNSIAGGGAGSGGVIEGTIVDNETGGGVGGAGVGGEAHSEIISINVQADANGHFRIELPAGENHTYVLNISAPGYDNRTVTGSVKSSERKNLGQIRINYNPFDVQLAENSGSLTRGWVENRYNLAVVDNYKATRQVVTGYKDELYYGPHSFQIYYPAKLYTSKVPRSASYNATFWDGYLTTYYDTVYGSNNPLRSEVPPNSFQSFNRGSKTSYLVEAYKDSNGKPHYGWTLPGWMSVPGSLESAPAFRGFQGFHETSSWVTLPVFGGSGLFIEYYITAPTYYSYIDIFSVDTKSTPLYGTEEYTVWRTTTYDVRDSALNNWGIRQTTLTATPRNGYTGGVKLALEFDNGIDAALGKSELQFASPASTTLTLTPKPDTHGSPHSATLRAYDSNGRLVIGSPSRPAPTYNLGLTTLPKPAVVNTVIGVTESETKPDEQGQGGFIPGQKWPIGASGSLYDKATGSVIPISSWWTGNVVSTISAKYQSSTTMSGMCAAYQYDHSSWCCHADEVWTMNPMVASATSYCKDTKSTTVSANNVNTVNFSLLKSSGP